MRAVRAPVMTSPCRAGQRNAFKHTKLKAIVHREIIIIHILRVKELKLKRKWVTLDGVVLLLIGMLYRKL